MIQRGWYTTEEILEPIAGSPSSLPDWRTHDHRWESPEHDRFGIEYRCFGCGARKIVRVHPAPLPKMTTWQYLRHVWSSSHRHGTKENRLQTLLWTARHPRADTSSVPAVHRLAVPDRPSVDQDAGAASGELCASVPLAVSVLSGCAVG